METYTKIIQFGQDYVIKKNDNDSITFIPCDESNSDYQAYLAWKAEQPSA